MIPLLSLLQATLALLLAVQNPGLPANVKQQALAAVSQSLKVYREASFKLPDSGLPVVYPWLSAKDLLGAEYKNDSGGTFRLKNGAYGNIRLEDQYISFGDLNKDSMDDAVVVMTETKNGSTRYYLAAVENFSNGYLFDVAHKELGKEVQIYDHRVQNGEFKIDLQADNQSRETRLYRIENGKFVLAGKI